MRSAAAAPAPRPPSRPSMNQSVSSSSRLHAARRMKRYWCDGGPPHWPGVPPQSSRCGRRYFLSREKRARCSFASSVRVRLPPPARAATRPSIDRPCWRLFLTDQMASASASASRSTSNNVFSMSSCARGNWRKCLPPHFNHSP